MTKPFIKFLLVVLCMSSGIFYANPQEDPISLKPSETPLPLEENPSVEEDEEDFESEAFDTIETEDSTSPTGEDLNFWDENKNAGAALWEGTPRKILDQFLPQWAPSPSLPALNKLVEQIILTGGFPKVGGSTPGSLSLKRAEILMNLGHGEDAFKVLQEDILSAALTPEVKNSYEQLQFLSLLSAHADDKACTLAISKGHSTTDTFWVKAKIICQELQGESEKAQVHLEALQEITPEAPLWDALESGKIDALDDIDALIVSTFSQKPIEKDTAKDEILAELKDEINETKNICTQIQDVIQKAPPPADPLATYFLQRLAKLYKCEDTHLGPEIPAPSWRQDLGAPKEMIDLLTAAAQAKRKGEVILLSAILLKDFKKIHPEVMIKILAALKAAGHDEEADALAFELLKAREGQ